MRSGYKRTVRIEGDDMAHLTVAADALTHDAVQFEAWSRHLSYLWNNVMQALSVSQTDVGSAGHMGDFYLQYSQALTMLNSYISGSDNPADTGGTGALWAFASVLRLSAQQYDQAAVDVETATKKLTGG